MARPGGKNCNGVGAWRSDDDIACVIDGDACRTCDGTVDRVDVPGGHRLAVERAGGGGPHQDLLAVSVGEHDVARVIDADAGRGGVEAVLVEHHPAEPE